MPDIEEVRERFSHDRFATENGAVIDEIGEGYAVCSMELENRHRNAMGAVMGGAIFTLADFAFAVASNWNKSPHVSLDSQIAFLGKAKGQRLIATATCIKEGRTTCFYEVTIKDELDNKVAYVTTNGFLV